MHGIHEAEHEDDQGHRPEETQAPFSEANAKGQEYDHREGKDLQEDKQEASEVLAQEKRASPRGLGKGEVNRSLPCEFREN